LDKETDTEHSGDISHQPCCNSHHTFIALYIQ